MACLTLSFLNQGKHDPFTIIIFKLSINQIHSKYFKQAAKASNDQTLATDCVIHSPFSANMGHQHSVCIVSQRHVWLHLHFYIH